MHNPRATKLNKCDVQKKFAYEYFHRVPDNIRLTKQIASEISDYRGGEGLDCNQNVFTITRRRSLTRMCSL